MSKQKVYGWISFARFPDGRYRQARFIMAASSVSEVMKATGLTRYQFNQTGCETGNDEEILEASARPGVPLFSELNHIPGNDWYTE